MAGVEAGAAWSGTSAPATSRAHDMARRSNINIPCVSTADLRDGTARRGRAKQRVGAAEGYPWLGRPAIIHSEVDGSQFGEPLRGAHNQRGCTSMVTCESVRKAA